MEQVQTVMRLWLSVIAWHLWKDFAAVVDHAGKCAMSCKGTVMGLAPAMTDSSSSKKARFWSSRPS